MRWNKKILISLTGAYLLGGCNELLEQEPIGQVVVDNFFIDSRGALAGLNGAYNALTLNGTYQEQAWKIGDITSDDTYRGNEELELFQYNSTSGFVSGYWNSLYTGIYRTNVLLNRVPDIPFTPSEASLKPRILGEARFLRGLYYFHLVRVFGGVPLITEEISSPAEAAIARATADEVYTQIVADLQEAIQALPDRYSGGLNNEQGRATKGAARALLAKVHMTRRAWAPAVELLGQVINSGQYNLFPNYIDNFQGRNENGIESVFEVQFVGPGGPATFTTSYLGHPDIVATTQGYEHNAPTDNTNPPGNPTINGGGLVQAFGPGDTRKDATMSRYGLVNPDGTPGRYLLHKYFNTSYSFRQSGVNYPLIRFSDVLLMYAEAVNEASGPTAAAYTAINRVRERARPFLPGPGGQPSTNRDTTVLPNLQGLSKDQFREAVYQERRLELAGEGHRWFDLLRTGRAIPVMAAHGRTVTPDRLLFPIPQSEIDRNSKLRQNPGYE